MLNNHNIILLFSNFYNIYSFHRLLFKKSYDYEVILIFLFRYKEKAWIRILNFGWIRIQ